MEMLIVILVVISALVAIASGVWVASALVSAIHGRAQTKTDDHGRQP